MSILNQYVNYFPKATATKGTPDYYGKKIILREILVKMHTNARHLQSISKLRALPKEDQRTFKETQLACSTISGYFEKDGNGSRNAADLIYTTNIICLDLDPKDPNVDLKALKRNITSEPFVAYCGNSCRGEGIFALIHISDPSRHISYFDFFACWLEANNCLSAFDRQTKNINRLRFIAPDPSYYINDNTKPFQLPKTIISYSQVHRKSFSNTETFIAKKDKFTVARKILEKQALYFTEGEKHNYIYNLCCLLNKMGVVQSEAEAFISILIPLSEVKSNCIDYPYKNYTHESNTWNIRTNNSHDLRSYYAALRQPEQGNSLPKEFKLPQPTKNEEIERTKAWVDTYGKLYIPTPLSDTYTIRESIEHYNNRNGSISFIKTTEVDIKGLTRVYIDPVTLKINNDLKGSDNTGYSLQTPLAIKP